MLVYGPPHPLAGMAQGPISRTWRRQFERPGRSSLASPVSVPPALIKLRLPFMKRPPPAMVPYKAGHRDPTLRARSQARQLHLIPIHSLSLSPLSQPCSSLPISSQLNKAPYSLNPRSHHSIYQHSFLNHSSRKPAAAPGISLTALKPIFLFFLLG